MMEHNNTQLLHPSNLSLINPHKAIIESLDLFQCGFIDFPESRVDCSIRQPGICIKCAIRGGYLSGESIDNLKASGHLFCRIIWIICLFVGSVGVFANSVIILVLRRRRTNRSFDLLLTLLGYVDLFCCLTSLCASTAPVAFFDNWFGRGRTTLYGIYISVLSVLLCRSMSIYITCLVTLERYLVIAYPLRSRTWFSRSRTKLQVVLIILVVTLFCMPRYTSLYIGENIYSDAEGHLNVPSLSKFEYIFRPTRLYQFWFGTLGGTHDFWLHVLEFWIPIPILVFFNVWSCKKVYNIRRQRLYLNTTQRKELQVACMFVPVVIVLLFCNIWTVIALVTIYIKGVYYREMWMIMVLTFQVTSASNFFIYYFQGTLFRTETNELAIKIIGKLRRRKPQKSVDVNIRCGESTIVELDINNT